MPDSREEFHQLTRCFYLGLLTSNGLDTASGINTGYYIDLTARSMDHISREHDLDQQ